MSRILARPDAVRHTILPRHLRASRQDDEISTARSRAARSLLTARTQARAIMEAAQMGAQAQADDALRAGWEQGYAAGLEQARQDQATMLARLGALVSDAAVAHEEAVRNVDESVVALTLALARVVVRHEVRADPGTILDVARGALGEMAAGAVVVLRVHPADVALLEARIEHLGLPSGCPLGADVTVRADETISPGGCLIESGAGRVDATLDRQLDRIGVLLHEQLGTAQP